MATPLRAVGKRQDRISAWMECPAPDHELRSRDEPYMPAVAWAYQQPPDAQRTTPTTPTIPAASARHYRYGLQGDSPPWPLVSQETKELE